MRAIEDAGTIGMSQPSAPLPPRQTGMPRPPAPRTPAQEMMRGQQRASMLMTIVFFIIGLSVVLSFNWTGNPPGFMPDAPVTILFGVLVAAIIYIAANYARRQSAVLTASLRTCPACGRSIPGDALLCPYCGTRLS